MKEVELLTFRQGYYAKERNFVGGILKLPFLGAIVNFMVPTFAFANTFTCQNIT